MEPSQNPRLAILMRDAELKLLEPLQRHGWRTSIDREVEGDDHLVMSAERGGQRRTFALLYSSASSNATYKKLAAEVDIIILNGDAYRLEDYAHGVAKPVIKAEDFHSVLVDWNRETSDGQFAPEGETEEVDPFGDDEGTTDHRQLLSETPVEAIWLRLRQLQSVKLAQKLIRDRSLRSSAELTGPTLASKAEGVAYALRNATDYFNASQTRNVSQRILNLYYGSMSFAFAEMLAAPNGPVTLAEIESSTKQGHGLYTVDGRTSGLEDIVVGTIRSGFFASWMRFLGKDADWIPAAKAKSFAAVEGLPVESWLSLEDLFARIPEISDLFQDIFDSPALWLQPSFDTMANHSGSLFGGQAKPTRTYLALSDVSGRMDREDVAAFSESLSEIRSVPSKSGRRRYRAAIDHEGHATWWDVIDVHTSPFIRQAIIKPVFRDVAEYRAICFVLLYALSIVVRYRPSVWRRVQEGDLDHMRVLIEAFLAVVERVLPEHFLASISGVRISVHQPGSIFG